MHSLPPYTFALVCISVLVAATILVLGALVLPITPVLWTIPGAFIITMVYHFMVVLTSNVENERSRRLFSTFAVAGAYLLTAVWTGILAISVTFTLLLALGKLKPPAGYPTINPTLITMSGVSLLHPFVLVTMGVILHRERKQDRYRQKWQWKTQINTSNWSIGQDH